MSTSADAAPRPVSTAPRVSATLALTLLVCINLFNYIDRQVLAAVEPEIRRELLVDAAGKELDTAKYWTGWFATAFLVSYMLLAPLFGMMADRFSRWGLVGFGVVLWSLASGASGLNWVGLWRLALRPLIGSCSLRVVSSASARRRMGPWRRR